MATNISHKTLTNLESRTKELRKAENQIRNNIANITAMFGDEDTCVFCNQTKDETRHSKYTQWNASTNWAVDTNEPEPGATKTKDSTEAHELNTTPSDALNRYFYYPNEDYRHDFNARIQLDLGDVEDQRIIEEETKLVLKDDKILISYGPSDYDDNVENTGLVSRTSMEILQKIVEGNFLVKFIQQLSDQLDTRLEAYKKTAEIAKKLADSIKEVA